MGDGLRVIIYVIVVLKETRGLREQMDFEAPDTQKSIRSVEDYLNALLLNLDII